jgi:hypothetical protein
VWGPLASLILITAACCLTVGSAIAAGRAQEATRRNAWLAAEAASLLAVLAVAVGVSFTGGAHGKGLVAVVSVVVAVFGFVLGSGALYAGYALAGRADRFMKDLAGSLWLGLHGPRPLDPGPHTAPR